MSNSFCFHSDEYIAGDEEKLLNDLLKR